MIRSSKRLPTLRAGKQADVSSFSFLCRGVCHGFVFFLEHYGELKISKEMLEDGFHGFLSGDICTSGCGWRDSLNGYLVVSQSVVTA